MIVAILLCGASAALCVQAALLLRPEARRESAIAGRLAALGAPVRRAAAIRTSIARHEPLSHNERLDALLEALPGPRALATMMRGAGMELLPARLLLLAAGGGALIFLLAIAVRVPALAAAAAGAIAAAAPFLYLRFRAGRRVAAFGLQLPDALELLVRTLRAGNALTAGMRLVAEEMPDPLAREFALVHEEVRLGRDLGDSLGALRRRVDTVDVRLLCTSLLVQRETGGNLVEVLDNLAALIRRRIAFEGKLSALTAEGRLSALILTALPPSMVLILFALNAPYARMLTQAGPLRAVLLCAAVLQIIGAFWIRSIVRVRY